MGQMSDQQTSGWQPLGSPRRRQGADAFYLSPFARLARTHLLTTLGDALVTISLAGSLFFSVDAHEARWKVFLYLVLTVAPLALVAPFIGPALDRSHGGRRWMVVACNGGRAVLCLLMVGYLDSLWLFPVAFGVLALGKAYGVAGRALVPTVVRNDHELVEANSKLQMLSGLAAPLAGVVAGPIYALTGAEGVVVEALLVYAAASLAALRIPSTQVAHTPVSAAEAAELRGVGVLLASGGMAVIRGIVGFLTLLLVFAVRDEPKWHLGLIGGLTGAGALVGAALAPRLRQRLTEERMLMATLGFAVVVASGAAWRGGLAVSAAMGATIAIVSTCARMAFDSIVQRDAPDANRGRSFARFEVRFQLAWVLGAVLPLLFLPIPVRVGFAGIAIAAAFALFSYVAGQRTARRHPPQIPVHGDVELYDQDHPTAADATAADATAADATAVDATALVEGDRAGWQVGDPTWGGDPTTPADRTQVQGYWDDVQ
jgi:MFS-type transporter involved in bile tolerance (Atg22 family)